MSSLKVNSTHKIIMILLIKSMKNNKNKEIRALKIKEVKLIVKTLNNKLKVLEYE